MGPLEEQPLLLTPELSLQPCLTGFFFFFACLLLAKLLSLVPVDKLDKLVLSFPVQASAIWGALGSFRVVVMEISAGVQSRKAHTF